ncbi:sigma-70 family RNA polymerase sigma factor [Candidatus Saccharibacteria bacterium]|nr:sigma-70 family RNA polymerase sigma factor [Candidatus Saccharibacteria bacterium]
MEEWKMNDIWIDELIEQYTIGKKQLEEYRETLNLDIPQDSEDYRIVGEMISDMQYALDWMKRGRKPENRREIGKKSIYQRRVLMDMDLLPSFDLRPSQTYLTDDQREKLIDVLVSFSGRERQCYLLHFAQGLSLQEIADQLGLSKRTVQQYVDRAREKIKSKVS